MDGKLHMENTQREASLAPIPTKGKGKMGRIVRRKTTSSLDDQLVTRGWRYAHTTPSPDAKARRRNQSEEPERDRTGNMYYKVDPAMMTDFMNNVKATQKNIQETIARQNTEIENERKNRRLEMQTWYKSLGSQLKQDMTTTKESGKRV